MKQRVITGCVIAIITLLALYLGGAFFNCYLLLIGVCGIWEAVHVFHKTWPSYTLYILPILSFFLFGIAMYFPEYMLVSSIVFFFLLVLFMIKEEAIKVNEISLVMIVCVLCTMALSSLNTCMKHSVWLVLFTFIGTYMVDTFALFSGKFFGKHKLCERLSPKKTIEGAIGGALCSMTICFIYGYFLLPNLSIDVLIALVLGMSFFGQVGDLFFSAIKRLYDIKDFSQLLPGHGGVLDRIDSLLFNLMYVFVILVTMVK